MYELITPFLLEISLASLVAASIALEHHICYRRRLTPLARYTLGVLAIAVPFSIAVPDIPTLIVLWSYILVAGITTLALYLWRARRQEWNGELDAHYRAGLVVGAVEEPDDGATGKR